MGRRREPGRGWLKCLATVASVGLGIAFGHGANSLLGLLTRPTTALADAVLIDRVSAPPARRADPQAGARAASPKQLAAQILARNIFDSAGAARDDGPAQTPPAPEQEVELGQAPVQRCDPGLRLVASIVDAARPERSLAAVRKDDRLHMLAPGRQLGELRLVSVQPASAYMQASDGAWCTLSVFAARGERPAEHNAAPESPAPVKAKSHETRAPASFYSTEELDRGVRSLGGRGYAVARELVLRALTDPGKAAAGAQFRAVSEHGHSEGMEVRSVRGDSLLQRIGIQNGDVVRSVNGADVTSPTGLLSAIRALRQADTVTIELRRGGAVQNVHYQLD